MLARGRRRCRVRVRGRRGYRPDRELIIDPGVEYSTSSAASSHELAAGIKVDAAGNAYVVGTTQSPDFPDDRRRVQTDRRRQQLRRRLRHQAERGRHGARLLDVHRRQQLRLGPRASRLTPPATPTSPGRRSRPNFPTTGGAFDRTFNVDTCPRCGIDQYDAFVTKLNAAGSALVYSTFLGGFDIDDGAGHRGGCGGQRVRDRRDRSLEFPDHAPAPSTPRRNGAFDAFVTKLNAAGSALVYSTYPGRRGRGVRRRASPSMRPAMRTSSARPAPPTFPTTAGAFDTTRERRVRRVRDQAERRRARRWSTPRFSADRASTAAGGLAVDAAGNAYVSGGAGSRRFSDDARRLRHDCPTAATRSSPS